MWLHRSTDGLFVGQEFIHEEGHSDCVSGGDDDVSVVCLGGDDDALCRVHPADPLHLWGDRHEPTIKTKTTGSDPIRS